MSDYLPLWFIAGAVALLLLIGYAEYHEQSRFMDACLQDHKEYECTAMWRAGESHTVFIQSR